VVATIAGAIVTGFAQLDTFGWRALAAGATIALTVVGLAVRGRVDEPAD
jgi:hypothetical protein